MAIKTTDISKKKLYKSLANKLYELFVMNKKYFAEQLQDGNYNTKNNIMDPLRIHDMLVNKKSYLTYQQVKTKLKWICLDFDIDKAVIKRNDSKHPDKYMDLLIDEVKKVSRFLDSLHIKYITEFSGNRGIHIWIVFTESIEKSHAYQLIQRIEEEFKESKNSNINVDVFPKNGNNNNNRVGFGVKLPLSFHTKSQCYSYLIEDIYSFSNSVDNWRSNLDESFLNSQLSIMSNYELQKFNDVVTKLDIELIEEDNKQLNPFISTRGILKETRENLDSILDKLSQCNIVKELLKNYPNNLNENERVIFVGLLNRLKTSENDNYGKELLWEFFSKIDNFRPDLTKKKLENLNLYPPTCVFLRTKFPQYNCDCDNDVVVKKQGIVNLKEYSPLRYLKDTELVPYDAFEVKEPEIDRIRKVQKKYTKQNDEIPFLFTHLELDNINHKDFKEKVTNTLNGKYKINDFYKFNRYEKDEKIRTLYALPAEEKIISTYLIKTLNSFYYTEFSDNSYGYKFENSFANYNIFKPWMQQWLIYRNRIMERLNEDLLEDHYVLKLDIKNFYSSINLGRLRTKLIHGPSKIIEEKISLLSEEQLNKYNNLIDYLMNLCEAEKLDDKGVPQGPAFARYLAEVYLIELDEYIENLIEVNFNFYYRYVDDIILILEDEKMAKIVLGKIKSYLDSLDLEINWDKYLLLQVKNSRNTFENYFNNNKYFVDNASKTHEINSDFTNKRATKILTKMVKPNIDEINEDNLSFYFTHFNDNKRLLEEKKKLETFLFSLKIGRGSLFRNYFSFYFSNNNAFENFVENTKLLEGLARGSFLNALFERVFYNNFDEKNKIISVIKELDKTRLVDYELELIISLMLLDNEYIESDFLNEVNDKTLLKVIGFKFNKRIPSVLEEKILNILWKQRDIKRFVTNSYNLVFYNSLSSSLLLRVSEMFFYKINQTMGTTEPVDFSSSYLDNREIINKYYNLCCLLSVSEKNYRNIERVWTNLITYVNRNYPNIEIDYNHWLKRTSALNFEEIDKNNLNTILIIKIHDNFVDGNGDIDHLKLYDHFHTGLVLFLMEIKGDEENITDYLNQEGIDIIKEIQLKYNLEFISWILDEENVQMYPNKLIGKRNIIENDRIVLQRANQLLVRVSKQEVLTLKFDYLKGLQFKEEKWLKGEYVSIIFNYNRNDYVFLNQFMKNEEDFYSYIGKFLDVLKGLNIFKEKYLKNPEIFPNIMGDNDLIHKDIYFPLIPFSSYDQKLILSETEIIDNDKKNFYKAFFKRVYNDIELYRGKPYVIKTNDLNTHFFPDKLKVDPDWKISYLQHLYKILDNDKITDPFYFELCKFESIISFVDEKSNILGNNRGFYSYLEFYHSIYKENEDKLKLLFYPIRANDSTLYGIFKTIGDSVKYTMQSVGNYNGEVVSKSIEKEMNFMRHFINESFSEVDKKRECDEILELFKKGNIQFDDNLNEISLSDEYTNIPEDEWSKIFLYNAKEKEPFAKNLELSNINVLENTEQVFIYKYSSKYYIIILPDIIGRTIDCIRTREKLYKRYEKEMDFINLDCFINNTDVERNIIYDGNFDNAVKIIQEQSFYIERELMHIRSDLVSWIRRFDKKYHKALLNVIASHKYIKDEEIASYFSKIKELLEGNNLFFHIKSAEDDNGFHRMTSQFQSKRQLKLDEFVSRVLKENTSEYELVILSEIGISGSQIINALKRYYLSGKLSEEARSNSINIEKYYPIKSEEHEFFKNKIKLFNKIHLVFISYTDKSKEYLKREISDLFDMPTENINFFPVESSINFNESVLISNPNIDVKNQKLLEELIRDSDFIAKLYNFDKEKEHQYNKYIRDLDKTREKYNSDYNLILRKGSTPKKSHRLFTLESDNLPALFERTKEHKED